jgi:hypothetical protein
MMIQEDCIYQRMAAEELSRILCFERPHKQLRDIPKLAQQLQELNFSNAV